MQTLCANIHIHAPAPLVALTDFFRTPVVASSGSAVSGGNVCFGQRGEKTIENKTRLPGPPNQGSVSWFASRATCPKGECSRVMTCSNR